MVWGRGKSAFRRRLVHATSVLVAGVAIFAAACSERGGSRAGRGRLVYWPAANPQEVELARKLVDEWNRLHPDIPVEMQPVPESQSTEEVLLTAIAGRTTPDVCSNIWPGAVAQFVRARGLLPLHSFPDFDSLVQARLPEGLIEEYRQADGGVYEIPWKINPVMLEYNVAMFRQAGYDRPPATYGEFLEAGRRITRDLDGDGLPDQWLMLVDYRVKWWLRFFDFYAFYLAASRGQMLVADREVLFDNQAAVQVFRFFREGFAWGLFPRSTFQVDAFLLGKVACHTAGPWNIEHVERFKPPGFEYDYAPIPVPDSSCLPAFTYGDPKNIGIFTTTRRPREAWEFAKFLVSPHADSLLLAMCSQLPVRRDLLDASYYRPYFDSHPRMIPFAEAAQRIRGPGSVPELKEIFDAISHEFETCCFYGHKSPEEAVHDAARRAREILR
ncbi:MAG: extracellular solute-binding protein [candidate division KSB1 bacterium]|nr:extracellular solute-binding protein [candidate division KSB1 bacterium]